MDESLYANQGLCLSLISSNCVSVFFSLSPYMYRLLQSTLGAFGFRRRRQSRCSSLWLSLTKASWTIQSLWTIASQSFIVRMQYSVTLTHVIVTALHKRIWRQLQKFRVPPVIKVEFRHPRMRSSGTTICHPFSVQAYRAVYFAWRDRECFCTTHSSLYIGPSNWSLQFSTNKQATKTARFWQDLERI